MTRLSRESPRTLRIVGGFLAAVWLAAALGVLITAALTERWSLLVLGIAALWYGLVWIKMARLGRRLTAREALRPWRP